MVNVMHNQKQVPELPVLSPTAGQGKNPSGWPWLSPTPAFGPHNP
jgi:hypothetical protein